MNTHPATVGHINTPCLVIDYERMERNIRDMAEALNLAGVSQRPHFKTSKTIEVAQLQQSAGAAIGFTCATANEVQALLDNDIRDIFWAHNPATLHKATLAVEFNTLGRVTVGIDSLAQAELLSQAAQDTQVVVPIRLEIDTGLRRTGIAPDDALAIVEQLVELPGVEFEGLYMHEGQLASMRLSREELVKQGRAAAQEVVTVADTLREAGHPVAVLSVGSTPGWESAPFVEGITEARAGTYVFYDANQFRIGSCDISACALTVHTSVISLVRDDEIVVDAGIKAMSSDGSNRDSTLGIVIDDEGKPIEGLTFTGGYEEHGLIKISPDSGLQFNIGDRLRVIPNHACGTVNMWSSSIVEMPDGSIQQWNVVGRH